IILEEYHKGDDYRVCVVNNKVVGVSLRVPPYIIGDGNKTVEELIDQLNSHEYRGEGHEKPLTKVKKDAMLNSFILEQGYTLNSILEKDKKLLLFKFSIKLPPLKLSNIINIEIIIEKHKMNLPNLL
ncbi:hypothetical protein H9X78_14370, partial [Clostridium saudiense]|nr:hypothetical protein [Clostridium saudiense]